MKIRLYLLVGLLLSTVNIFAYRAGSIGISTRFEGASTVMTGTIPKGNTLGISTTVLEFYTSERKGRGGYTPLVQIRLSTPFKQATAYLPNFVNEFRWGFLFGGSHRLLNQIDKETGTGWSLLLDGGFFFDFPTISRFKAMSLENPTLLSPVNLGIEISLKTVYNIQKYLGITFGANIGYEQSFSAGNLPTDNGASSPLKLDGALTYGFSVGLLF